MNSGLPNIVLKRSDKTTGGDGWIVGCPEDEEPPPLPYLVLCDTVVLDANWDGPVWLGGECRPAKPASDGRPMFKCIDRIAPKSIWHKPLPYWDNHE